MYPKESTFLCRKCGFEKKKTGSNVVVNKQNKKEGSDEPESRFYTCTKCGRKWRED